ncbi:MULTISPECIES: hypothetical protein [Myxococcus]|uniref:Uncharacterized protein n=1 Tax=Myxococcus llanfairpwllgwyngyllgogerychwyrndrobwllllantysiliogogogochensis TaxID=2590453 RepID=A0A540X074_9BACT|nr:MULTISPECIES: hypothetical protein [Myxococcus]NTX02819.1 hypothetical protein [Myxococcus sp. CA040A]TQF14668.1 hypothetical protein FJV41_17585 [Myxococcus llanfairpwllgwyngyllgogerychwyrndrobwllllantysiliogogogochensis]
MAATVVADTTRPSLFSLLLVSERESFPSPAPSDSLVPVSLLLERDSLDPPSSELWFEFSLEPDSDLLESPDPFDESPDPFDESPDPSDEPPDPDPEPEPSDDPSDALIPPLPVAPGVRHPVTPSNTAIPNASFPVRIIVISDSP